ncbi:potassium transporter Kup [Iodidimonas sp. SYSU 1G8]|uniref:potassium transporter Kup n=1 Tax=Iodidimonas sp. SYSU 1G8 TaxID=3133967 RepID=UPI0031FE7151
MSPDTHKQSFVRLALGAVGVVFGDIGTSPLYTMKEAFAGAHPLALDAPHVYGVISLIFWAVMAIVSFKYVMLMMRADNKGEGGSLALLTLVSHLTQSSRLFPVVALLGIFAAALFYGDSMITPAISVLGAVEGLEIAAPGLHDLIVPITVVILIGLFVIQKHGTAVVGRFFGPIMLVWFLTLAGLGVLNIIDHPEILAAVNPYYAVDFFIKDQWIAFLALGSVVLAVTGAEALYADMGHFGRPPIRRGWFALVLPALMLNYFGQGALLINDPAAIDNPFYRLAPDWALWPLLGLATLAAIIASQAVISGAFSVTRQAVQLGYLPRLRVQHTSEAAIGQIYVPFVNWSLLVAVILLVLGFGSSTNLAAAYGVAVTATMFIDTLLLAFVMFMLWRIPRWRAIALLTVFVIIDLAFLGANLTKIPDGGWFPLFAGLALFVLLTTWKRGRLLVRASQARDAIPTDTFLASLSAKIQRVPGTAVYMSGRSDGVPHALLHNLKHNKVLHDTNIFLTMQIEEVPRLNNEEALECTELREGFFRIIYHYGFMQDPDVPRALRLAAAHGFTFNMMQTSFFLGRETVIPSVRPGMAMWRESLFAWMTRNAASAMDFFEIPANRVVEMGSQIEI